MDISFKSPWDIRGFFKEGIFCFLNYLYYPRIGFLFLCFSHSLLTKRTWNADIGLLCYCINTLFFNIFFFPLVGIWLEFFFNLGGILPRILHLRVSRYGAIHEIVVSSLQGWLHGCVTCAVARGPELRRVLQVGWSSAGVLKFLIIFEQGTPHFHFALSSTSCVAFSASLSIVMTLCQMRRAFSPLPPSCSLSFHLYQEPQLSP